MCLSRTGKRWISVVVSKWSVFQNTVTYIDDVLVFSPSLEKHVKHLKRVITSLAKAGLKLKSSKCKFVRSEVC